jgi:hypothetical protein
MSCWTLSVLPEMDLSTDFVGSNTWEHSYSGDLEARMEFLLLHTPIMHHSCLVAKEEISAFLTDTFTTMRPGNPEKVQ